MASQLDRLAGQRTADEPMVTEPRELGAGDTKQRNASSGVHTIGSPRTLKLVLTSTGQPFRALKREIKA
jgi:hypothetical protein